ncbi:acyltransferase family protein [Sphingomonas crocodyli]|uniref:Acyltransferase n=1 Tax=Sphingomonas crocodyli TaxID=1979270 RepID=A0A437LXW9_9SPHN|nr:acyltransferase [Sphingomonas crocodyli]RVT90227.1 acyltransferase [Sphingomonas crocodyli]
MTRVACLDGLRGLAALWVLVGHTMILTGLRLPILAQPDLGVDLFILLSGFLMVFQFHLRETKEDWGKPATWASFWLRRLFRLAPLFYVLLIPALYFGPAIFADRTLIDNFLGAVPQAPARYLDASITNIVAHITFVFGLLPEYAYRTPLPDWSLGLEMQFYAVFPLIILLQRRIGWIATGIILALGSIAVVLALKSAGVHYPMPSFLPLKMHLFLCGMLIAAAQKASGKMLVAEFALVAVLAVLPVGEGDLKHRIVRELLVVGFFGLVHWQRVVVIRYVSNGLGSAPLRWLGDVSYGVYLIHLLLLHRFAAWAIDAFGQGLSPLERFAVVFPAVAVLSYALAWIGFTQIEERGNALGKRLIGRFFNRNAGRSTSAEQIAAP